MGITHPVFLRVRLSDSASNGKHNKIAIPVRLRASPLIKKTPTMKKQKYFSRKVTNRYGTFDSSHEFQYYLSLLDRQKKGEIYGLRKQISIEIIPKRTVNAIKRLKTRDKVIKRVDEHNAVYTCDFAYYDNTIGKYVMLEYKSPMTASLSDYILRRKLVKQVIDKHNKKKALKQWVFIEVIMNSKKKK